MECTFNGQSPANSKQGSGANGQGNRASQASKPKGDFLDPNERSTKHKNARGSSGNNRAVSNEKVGGKDFSNFKSVMDSGQIHRMVTLKKKKTGGSSHIREGPELVKNYSNDHYSMEDRDSAIEDDRQ